MSNLIAKAADVWIDEARCTGCGACVEVCPTGAITLVKGKAHLNPTQCQGCKACIQACPTGALQPVLKPQLVSESNIMPAASHLPEVQKSKQPAPLRDAALAAVVATGTKLVMQVVPALARTLTRALSGALDSALSSSRETPAIQPRSRPSTTSQRLSRGGGGRRARHRRRGR